MSKIKICGIRRKEDIQYVNESNPDYIGFVFANSKRKVTKEEAKELRVCLNPSIIPVGVFVNEQSEVVAELLNTGIIDVAQLHGDEEEAYIAKLRQLMKRGELIKAVRVADEEDVRKAASVSAEYLLFDTYTAGVYGGTGKCFDWSLLKDVKKPFFLAGGIGADNVEQALNEIRPYAVDVSSSVETNGLKDRVKIMEVVQRVRKVKTYY